MVTSPIEQTGSAPGRHGPADRRDWVARANSVSALIEAEIPVSEAARTMSAPVVDALRQTGLFWMLAPTEVGGGGCGIGDLVGVIETLSFADCSAGWAFMANATSIAAAGAYCGATAVDAMFLGDRMPIMAGMFGPGGKAERTEGGYQASGKFSFGSGCAHADWFAAGMLAADQGRIRQTASGPEVRVCFIPRERVEVLDNWQVAGLSATGSFDYHIPDQFVPDDFTMQRAMPEQRRGRALFQLGFAPVVSAGHVGVVLGAMKRALHEIARISGQKRRVGYPGPIGEYPTFMQEFSSHEAAYMSARAYAIAVFDEAEATIEAGGTVSDYHVARFRQVGSWLHKIASDVIRGCYTWSGAEGFRGSTPIGLAFRDMHVATNHLFIDPVHLVLAAPAILDHYRQRDSCLPGKSLGR